MAKKIKALSTFIGTSDEVKQFGGGVPLHFENVKHKLSDEDYKSFHGKITAGTELTVSDKRADELEAVGLVKIVGNASGEDKEMEQAQGPTNKQVGEVLANEKKVPAKKAASKK